MIDLLRNNSTLAEAVSVVSSEYRQSSAPWFLGYSGGKDSTALLRLTYHVLKRSRKRSRPVHVVYCDTGVEIPVVRDHALATLTKLRKEALSASVPLRVHIARPALDDRYFVKVIGRGYPPPSFMFRWCTDRLRIYPVRRIIAKYPDCNTVLLGLRRGESQERDRTIAAHHDDGAPFFLRSESKGVRLFAPMIKFHLNDVWEVNTSDSEPNSIDSAALATLYKHASGECPTIREQVGAPCGKGRFGCWTCTVVRRDRAVISMIQQDRRYISLSPLLRFRDWLIEMKCQEDMREVRRRNGAAGPGPFTLAARLLILNQLKEAELLSRYVLLRPAEERRIHQLWKMDAKRKRENVGSETTFG